jgi:two-component system LytT family response regulator
MRLRSIIIDDEETGVDTLRLLIEKYVDNLKVVATSTRAKEAIELIENYKPEIVFLDISMPEMNGFELLNNLTWKSFNLIFTTAHQEYGLKALKVNAIDYLLKPIDPKDLCVAVDKIRKQITLQHGIPGHPDYSTLNSITQYYTEKLGVSTKNGIEYLDPFEIICLESKSNYTQICLTDGKVILTPKNLGEFESILCQNNLNFMRVHYSFIINLHKAVRYIKEDEVIITVSKQKIPLAKSKREIFFKWLNA